MVNLFTARFPFYSWDHVWDIWNWIISFHYLTEKPWKDSLCDMFSLSVNLWLAFDGKLSDGLLSLYFVYIDLLVRGRWIYSGKLFLLICMQFPMIKQHQMIINAVNRLLSRKHSLLNQRKTYFLLFYFLSHILKPW